MRNIVFSLQLEYDAVISVYKQEGVRKRCGCCQGRWIWAAGAEDGTNEVPIREGMTCEPTPTGQSLWVTAQQEKTGDDQTTCRAQGREGF